MNKIHLTKAQLVAIGAAFDRTARHIRLFRISFCLRGPSGKQRAWARREAKRLGVLLPASF